MILKKYIPICIAILALTGGIVFAENKYPYVAQVVGSNVNTRAGAGVNHYRCGRLSEPETVVVIGEQFGFAKINPPKGSFSWIAKQYVDKKDDATGEVKGDAVRVWVGSPYVSAIHSSSSQVELNKGDIVTFNGKDEGNYYQILPPKGAALWINASYIKYMGPLSKFVPSIDKDLPVEPKEVSTTEPVINVVVATDTATDTVADGVNIDLDKPLSKDIDQPNPEDGIDAAIKEVEEPQKTVTPQERTKEIEAMDAYLDAASKIKTEKEKPLAVQDYTTINSDLEAIIADLENGRAVKFAEALLDITERYQAAQLADKAIREQDSELIKIRSEIHKNLKKDIEEINATTGHVMIGMLAKSYVYTTENGNLRYTVKDDNDSIIAYAIPTDSATRKKAESLIGKKVGLNGEVEPDENTSKVVVYFTDVKEIWEPEEKE